jgi:hypothetical protein
VVSPEARIGLAALLLSLAACGGDGGVDAGRDATLRREDASATGWSVETVATGDVGQHLQMVARADGSLVAVWMTTVSRSEGLCTEIGDAPPERILWDVEVARLDAGGRLVDRQLLQSMLAVGVPPGLDLALDADGNAVVATRFGEPLPDFGYCGVHDLGLFVESGSGFTERTVVTSSGEAATGMPASDFGEIVGQWPALAYGPGGRAVIGYRDVHAGGRQSDDLRRADFEVAYDDGGGFRPVAVDVGSGAGSFNDAVFTDDGVAYLVYVNVVDSTTEAQLGIWVARSADGEVWERVRLSARPTPNGPSIAVDGDGRVLVAYYDGERGQARVAVLEDADAFDDLAAGWTLETVGDPRFDEGLDPSLAVSPDGTVGLAYRRCARASEAGECAPVDDGLVFASRFGASPWDVEEVDPGEAGSCGLFPALAMTAAGPRIAYACREEDGGTAEDVVRVATRSGL